MRDIRLSRLFAAALVLATPAILPAPALAAGTDDVLKCLDIRDNAARLACYDHAVPALRQLPPPPPPAVAAARPTPPAAPVKPEEAFGAERMSKKERGITGDEVDTITAKLTEFRQSGYDRYTFTLDNGQVWTQSVARGLANLKTGRTVRIEKAALGSYNMVIDGVAGLIKVRRIK